MEIQDLTSTQDMEPNSIDLTFIIMKIKNLIQRGCRSGITSDSSNRKRYELLKNAPDKKTQAPKAEYTMKINTRRTPMVKSKPP